MDNNLEILMIQKMIQKELWNEICNKGLVDFVNTSHVIKKLEEDIQKLKESQEQDKDIHNIVVHTFV